MIASSLALALGVSVANAAMATINDKNLVSYIKVGTRNNFLNILINNVIQDYSANLEFIGGNRGDTTFTYFFDTRLATAQTTSIYTFATVDAGLWVGGGEYGTTTINNGLGATESATFNFNGTTNYSDPSLFKEKRNVALVSNVVVRGGKKQSSNQAINTKLNFNGDMIGNFSMHATEDYVSNAKLTFNNGASYWGNVNLGWEKAQMLFNSGNFTGDIILNQATGNTTNGGEIDVHFGTTDGTQASTTTPASGTNNIFKGDLTNNQSPKTLAITFWKSGAFEGNITNKGANNSQINITFKKAGRIGTTTQGSQILSNSGQTHIAFNTDHSSATFANITSTGGGGGRSILILHKQMGQTIPLAHKKLFLMVIPHRLGVMA